MRLQEFYSARADHGKCRDTYGGKGNARVFRSFEEENQRGLRRL